jgi:hypothetical protein
VDEFIKPEAKRVVNEEGNLDELILQAYNENSDNNDEAKPEDSIVEPISTLVVIEAY